MDFKIGDRVKIKENVLKDYFDSDIDIEKEYFITNKVWSSVFEIKDFKSEYTYNISEEYLIKIEETNKDKEFNNNDLCGRKFKILYKTYKSTIYNLPLEECNITHIEGKVLNFRPSKQVVLIDDKYGFNIIPFESIVYMEEIINNKN